MIPVSSSIGNRIFHLEKCRNDDVEAIAPDASDGSFEEALLKKENLEHCNQRGH